VDDDPCRGRDQAFQLPGVRIAARRHLLFGGSYKSIPAMPSRWPKMEVDP
jgi:hypothetical protein